MKTNITAQNIMVHSKALLNADMPLPQAIDALLHKQQICAPVCHDNGQLIGLVSTQQIMVHLWCQDYDLNPEQTLAQIVNPEVASVGVNDSLETIVELFCIDKAQLYPTTSMGYATELTTLSIEERAKRMKVHSAQIIPVLDNGILVGTISHLEVLAALRTLNNKEGKAA